MSIGKRGRDTKEFSAERLGWKAKKVSFAIDFPIVFLSVFNIFMFVYLVFHLIFDLLVLLKLS